MTVRVDTSAFFNLWQDKGKALGRPLTLTEACEATGLAPETIRGIKEGTTSRFDAPVISKLCNLLDVSPGPVPFLIYEPDTSDKNGHQ